MVQNMLLNKDLFRIVNAHAEESTHDLGERTGNVPCNCYVPVKKVMGHYVRSSVCSSVAPLKSLCNQLLREFTSNHFESLHISYKHFEDVHVNACRRNIFLTKLLYFQLRQF